MPDEYGVPQTDADRRDVACAWWALTITSAIQDGDEESRSQLAEATDDPEAWRKLSRIGDATDSDWTEFLAVTLDNPFHTGASRPAGGQPDYDAVLDEASEVMLKLAFGILDEKPEALPR